MSNSDKAEEWIEKADKKLKGGVLGGLFGGGSSKYEDAAEWYAKGANLYKVGKKFDKAGGAFIKAAECNIKAQSKHEAATNYINAANVYKKDNTAEAINCFKIAIELYTDEGRFSIAAKHQKELAELHESEMDYEHAMEAYQTAADYYEGENATSAATGCLVKVAQYAAQLEKYDKAVEVYEEVARKSLDNNLLKWSVKDYFFRAILCYLCSGDDITAKRQLEKYQEMDYSFGSQRECKFLQEIIAAQQDSDVEAFTQAVVEYDSVSKLDQWKTTILLRIKNIIKKEENGLA
eukprot:TRINITY_DN16831_c0_g1_i1.p1 TRINITY_DN16831_c0_g1~~TRINITY_DN16831_c0_g1_i1.p1  ORF type:complete len:292 (-),score=93.14 TRINITY_DN16831_c0_g1_i1:70-945(-)